MRIWATILSVLISTNVSADILGENKLHPFICDTETYIFVEKNNDWRLVEDPTIEVETTASGWRLASPNGAVGFLKKWGDAWNISILSEDGFSNDSCIDLQSTFSTIIKTLKPILDENSLLLEIAYKEELRKNVALTKNLNRNIQTQGELADQVVKLKEKLSAYDQFLVQYRLPDAFIYLDQLVEMGPSERNEEIYRGKFSFVEMEKENELKCLINLRDKGKLSPSCKDVLGKILALTVTN